jgi:AraC-like DNA-binding protein
LCLGDEDAHEFQEIFTMMERESSAKNSSPDVLRGYLQVLLGKAMSNYSNIATHRNDEHPSSGLRIVKLFMEAYMNDFNAIRNGNDIKLRKISEYAIQLGVSQNHLNDTVKAITGQSAGQLMRAQLIRQAAVCLKHSTKSISEISYRLGFEDPSYFTRFFKRQTGRLPSDHRLPVKSAIDPV